MKRYKYEITIHEAENFRELVYFCTATGECSARGVPGDQAKILSNLLNDRGREGWELVSLSFGDKGVLAAWKREA